MLKIGEYNKLEVIKILDFGLYLASGEYEILLPTKYIPAGTEIGDFLEVFLHTDSSDRPIATTLKPKAVLGEFAAFKVVSASKFGVFLDMGLEKDLLLPFGEQSRSLKVGETCVAKVLLDKESKRLYASTDHKLHTTLGAGELQEGDQVELIIADSSPLGFLAIINGKHLGMLYKNEIFEPLKVGDQKAGYIKKIRPDKLVDLTLRKTGKDAVNDSAMTVYNLLKSSGGTLPYNYKTSPETIMKIFKLSRKAYKRALTELIGSGKISVDENGMKWIA